MICSCGGKWIIGKVKGHLRAKCAVCGKLDTRLRWANGEYCGPPELGGFVSRLDMADGLRVVVISTPGLQLTTITFQIGEDPNITWGRAFEVTQDTPPMGFAARLLQVGVDLMTHLAAQGKSIDVAQRRVLEEQLLVLQAKLSFFGALSPPSSGQPQQEVQGQTLPGPKGGVGVPITPAVQHSQQSWGNFLFGHKK